MRVQKCIEVSGDQIADFRSSLGGRLICEVDHRRVYMVLGSHNHVLLPYCRGKYLRLSVIDVM